MRGPRLVTKVIEKEGPTNFVVTTTSNSLHPENETRMLSLIADDSAAQTTAVMRSVASGRKRTPADFADWHAYDRWIAQANHDVTVPYATWLADNIAPVAVRLRRDFATLPALIETHAIIHQLTRRTDEHGRIVATCEDYRVVRDLVADLMSEGVGQTVKTSVRETAAVVAELGGEEGVTVRQLAEHLGIERSAAQYRVKAARDGDYIKNIEDKGNKLARYVTDAPLPEERSLLPDPGLIPSGHLHTSHPGSSAEAADPHVAPRREGVNGERGGEADVSVPDAAEMGSCTKCGATCRRYGPSGNPLCKACRTPAPPPATERRPAGPGMTKRSPFAPPGDAA